MQAYIIMSQTHTFIFDKAQTTYDNDRGKRGWGEVLHKINRKVEGGGGKYQILTGGRR